MDIKYTPFKDGDRAFYEGLIKSGEPVPPIEHSAEPQMFSAAELEDMVMSADNLGDVRMAIIKRRRSVEFYREMENLITDHNYQIADKGRSLVKEILEKSSE